MLKQILAYIVSKDSSNNFKEFTINIIANLTAQLTAANSRDERHVELAPILAELNAAYIL